MASPGRDVKLSKNRVIGNRNFITKIWSANNFLQLNKCKYDKKINLNSIKLPKESGTGNLRSLRYFQVAFIPYI